MWTEDQITAIITVQALESAAAIAYGHRDLPPGMESVDIDVQSNTSEMILNTVLSGNFQL